MKRIFLSLLLIMLFAFNAVAQQDIYARQIKVRGRGAKLDGAGNIPLFWNGFYYGTYSGTTRDAFFMDYTGSGHYIFNWRADGQSKFLMNKVGRAVLTGDIRFSGSSRYINFAGVYGTNGYGIRDNAGSVEFKNSGGVWAGIAGIGGDPTFNSVIISGLTASRLVATNGSKKLVSTDATGWIAGTPNQVTINDDLDGSITVSTPQDLDIAANFTVADLDTGQGANELLAMNQDVRSIDSVTFVRVTASGRFVNSTITAFTDGDTTPTIAGTNVFKTGNTGGTSVTAFDNGLAGQEITIIFGDANTTIVDGANLHLQGGLNFTSTADDVIHFIYDGASWFESGSRSLN